MLEDRIFRIVSAVAELREALESIVEDAKTLKEIVHNTLD